jgi:hypothetical protein
MIGMAEQEQPAAKPVPDSTATDDDRRATAAAANRKRALEDWEEKKKKWRQMGVPPALPARK